MSLMQDARSYLEQSPSVKARLDRMKARNVILRVNNLDKIFYAGKQKINALQNISFQTHRREFLCIIGPSGCGKSTLIRILAGLETHSGGEVLLDGRPVTGPGRERGMVFQGYTLFPWLTVKKNVMFGLRMNGVDRADAAKQADRPAEIRRRLPAPALRRHEAACRDHPRFGEQTAHPSDGRTFQRP
jgi:NitT/TauT family transport system ATP-binding protein